MRAAEFITENFADGRKFVEPDFDFEWEKQNAIQSL